jgi:hypothetical protein
VQCPNNGVNVLAHLCNNDGMCASALQMSAILRSAQQGRTPICSSKPPGQSTIERTSKASSLVYSPVAILVQICVAARKPPTYSSSLLKKHRRSFLLHNVCSSSRASSFLNSLYTKDAHSSFTREQSPNVPGQ